MKKVTEELYRLGHLWHVSQTELADLSSDDPEFKKAVLSLQQAFGDEYHQLENIFHSEVTEQTGEVGPAFLSLLNTPRGCPLPDIAPPPGISFLFNDSHIQAAILSQQKHGQMQADSRGSGAWPYSCWDDYEMHRLVVAVKHDSMTSLWKTHWEWLVEQCRINYSWSGLRIDFVDWNERADVRMQWRGNSGWIGLAEFPAGTCSDEVFCYFRPSYRPSNRAYLLNLFEHELGHNNGLQHTRGNWIMNPTINLSNSDWRKDTHWTTLKRYYGGKGSPELILGNKKDDPDPPTTIELPTHDPNGVVALADGLYKIWLEKV